MFTNRIKKGDGVRIVWNGTVTSAGVVLKVRLRSYIVKHHHGRVEELAKANVRPALPAWE